MIPDALAALKRLLKPMLELILATINGLATKADVTALRGKIDNLETKLDVKFTGLRDELIVKFTELNEKLDKVLAAVTPSPTRSIRFNVLLEGMFYEGVTQVKISSTQQFDAFIDPRDLKGNPSQVEAGKTKFEVGSADLIEVIVSEDGLSAKLKAKGPIGSTQLSVTVDADLTEGEDPIVGVLQIEVVAGRTVALGINTSAPEEIPAPEPPSEG